MLEICQECTWQKECDDNEPTWGEAGCAGFANAPCGGCKSSPCECDDNALVDEKEKT